MKERREAHTRYITIDFPTSISYEDLVNKLKLGKPKVTMRYATLSFGDKLAVNVQSTSADAIEALQELIGGYNDKRRYGKKWTLEMKSKEVFLKTMIKSRLRKFFGVKRVELIGKGKSINTMRATFEGEEEQAVEKALAIVHTLRASGINGKEQSVCSTICSMLDK